jgi:hypothetical protein
MKWTANEIAIVAASTTIIVAIIAAWSAYMAGKADRRRALYSEATQAIIAWKEMLYRVRRRASGQETEIITAFHDLQSRLDYSDAWIGSESKFMSRSYKQLVKAIKSETEVMIQDAWKGEIRAVPGDAQTGDQHPTIDQAVEIFLRDVRAHLSPSPVRRWCMMYRNKRSG